MIITEREADQLRQLVDSRHPVSVRWTDGAYLIDETAEQHWAVEQVCDWRVQRGQVRAPASQKATAR